VTLIDTGPLVALIDSAQSELQKKCLSAVRGLSGSLITTLPCFTEAMYLLGEMSGWRGQSSLWRYVENEEIVFHIPIGDEFTRQRELMEQYNDTPMDFADASLVSLAELRGARRILTLDSDFYIYRIHGRESFEVVEL
jgi:predicted nucleic acid-binding protein